MTYSADLFLHLFWKIYKMHKSMPMISIERRNLLKRTIAESEIVAQETSRNRTLREIRIYHQSFITLLAFLYKMYKNLPVNVVHFCYSFIVVSKCRFRPWIIQHFIKSSLLFIIKSQWSLRSWNISGTRACFGGWWCYCLTIRLSRRLLLL